MANTDSGHKCHWRLEPPNGPESKGTCIFCNRERTFSNVPPYPTFRGRIDREISEVMACV